MLEQVLSDEALDYTKAIDLSLGDFKNMLIKLSRKLIQKD